jgi:hypothetical protein
MFLNEISLEYVNFFLYFSNFYPWENLSIPAVRENLGKTQGKPRENLEKTWGKHQTPTQPFSSVSLTES